MAYDQHRRPDGQMAAARPRPLMIVLALGWDVVEKFVRPGLIPEAEIARLADEIMSRYPDDPERAALIEEHAAWYRSQDYEQGKWRRVRKAIGRRLGQ